jgi:spore coat protein H
MPDSYYMPTTPAKAHQIAGLIPGDVETNYNLYLQSLKKPMPFYLGVPELNGSQIDFYWDEAYDFEGQDITYHFILGRDWEFKDVVYDQKLTNATHIQVDMLDPGEYFWKVTATNASGNTQYPFDKYYDTDSQPHPGVKRFYVTPNSEVHE